MASCAHEHLALEPSSQAQHAGYKRATAQRRLAAAQPSGQAPKTSGLSPAASTFPAPLVLPNDELSWDPDYDTQSLKSWLQLSERNKVTAGRRTIYVVPVPSVAAKVRYVQDWASPKLPSPRDSKKAPEVARPQPLDVRDYLAAFYHNLPVKLLSKPKLQFTSWGDESGARSSKKRSKQAYIALSIGSEAVRIRTRPSKDGFFAGQLNLDDLLDAAISLLPSDAYAVLLLVDHDLYEGEDDDFCCGRAYGGSRVAVISSARYNPALDVTQEVETEHAWPASHCQKYVDACLQEASQDAAPPRKKPKATVKSSLPQAASSALHAAVRAFSSISASLQPHSTLWLSRFCKTASHELGHCFGMDHCVYYACTMQGTAGLSEDVRQPPYLCPVDLAKVLRATEADVKERYEALLSFCERFEEKDRMFAAFAAWLRARIVEVGA
ncbi:hypothetical protein BBJ28_00003657 [Nothophytophthora sp. Chile5]|nr:hypothetical protein BBJ28_00003657 [Nothophytophthora sp. Chile5]